MNVAFVPVNRMNELELTAKQVYISAWVKTKTWKEKDSGCKRPLADGTGVKGKERWEVLF